MKVLKFTTAGSVDDGKSTLIGRLLYDTNSLSTDRIEAIKQASIKKGLDEMDLSFATDGLTAEREQGITIDVAHIYFHTSKRKFIIADTPGHVEYTRNMITGASNSQSTIILIDARNGIIEKTRRHLFITHLLKIKNVAVCINKMDLVAYSQDRFNQLADEVSIYADQLISDGMQLTFFPISAKEGDNVVNKSSKMDWYKGETLLDFLENVNIKDQENLPARFNVQYVIRPDQNEYTDYRGYAGKVVSGSYKIGDIIIALPSGRKSVITAIHRFKEKLTQANAGESVTLLLEHDIDISRGNLIVAENNTIQGKKDFNATICWMASTPLGSNQKFHLQYGAAKTIAKIQSIQSVINPQTLEHSSASAEISLNTLAEVQIKTANDVFLDTFHENPRNGAFILIDNINNNTVGVGFINKTLS